MMRKRKSTAAIIFLAVILGVDWSSWRGFGFRASRPEMPRLRRELALKPGMSVADQIRALVAAAGLQNVTVVQAHARDTGLPTNCCDAVVLRRVYHHLSDPLVTNRDLLRALRPGGVLAIIDFPPMLSCLWPWPPNGVPQNRGGHGIAVHLVVEEVTASGFELVKVIEDWPGRSPLASYCIVFRKPRDRQRAWHRGPGGPDQHPIAEKCWTARADASSWRDLVARSPCAMSRLMRLPVGDVPLLPSAVPRSGTQYVDRVAHVQALPQPARHRGRRRGHRLRRGKERPNLPGGSLFRRERLSPVERAVFLLRDIFNHGGLSIAPGWRGGRRISRLMPPQPI
jgi:SAM-dependent methyltransferase